jgi:hypothetical protein
LPSAHNTPLAVILGSGLLAQAVLIGIAHYPTERRLVGDEIHYHDEAWRLATGQPLRPTFTFPPLQFHVLAAVYRVFGPLRLPVELLQSALFIGAGLLFRHLLARAGLNPAGCNAALALFVLDPQLASFAQYLWPEVLHLFLALLGVRLLFASRSAIEALAAGVTIGLAILAKSLLWPFVPVLMAACALGTGAGAAQRWARAGVFAAGLGFVLTPVVVSNGVRYGYWGIANSGPFNVWVGLNDPASRTDYDTVVVREGETFLASSPDPAVRNRLTWVRIREHVGRLGIGHIVAAQVAKQYGRLFDKESFFTDQLPGGRWHPSKTPAPWDTACRGWAYAAYAIALVLAGFGLGLADWARRRRVLALPALFLVYNLGLFLLLHVKTRYRVAFLPSLLFFAGLAWERLPLGSKHKGERASGHRLLVGALIAIALLALAFGRACPRP